MTKRFSDKSKKQKQNRKLPKSIIALPNADKDEWHEKWYTGRDLLDFPHPFRGCFMGFPGCGKTNLVKNIFLRCQDGKNPFEEVYIIHVDADYTKEYNDLFNTDDQSDENIKILNYIPEPSEFPGLVKTLVILDDIELEDMPKDQRQALSRLYGFCSTHKLISCCLTSQNFTSIPSLIRRCSNIFVFWKSIDVDSLAVCSRKTGLKKNMLNKIFTTHMTEERDFLMIDLIEGSPAKYRKNGYTVLKYRTMS